MHFTSSSSGFFLSSAVRKNRQFFTRYEQFGLVRSLIDFIKEKLHFFFILARLPADFSPDKIGFVFLFGDGYFLQETLIHFHFILFFKSINKFSKRICIFQCTSFNANLRMFLSLFNLNKNNTF